MHRATTNPSSPSYDWLHFAARSGGEGSSWVEEYRRHEALEELSLQALLALRRHRVAEGVEILHRLEERLDALDNTLASVRHVLDRWYYGVLSYYFYTVQELDRAEGAMLAAAEAVCAAITRRRFLLPLANHCHEFCLHRARIARNRRRWQEMEALISEVREMMKNHRPLCVLGDGVEVFFATLGIFYESIPGLSDAEREGFSELVDDESRLRLFERFVRQLRVLPGFVIPYP